MQETKEKAAEERQHLCPTHGNNLKVFNVGFLIVRVAFALAGTMLQQSRKI